jgi:hypothetical protein
MHLMLTVTIVHWGEIHQSCDSVSFEPQETAPDVVASAYVFQTIQAWSGAVRTTECAPVTDSIDMNLCQSSKSRVEQNGSSERNSVVYSYNM